MNDMVHGFSFSAYQGEAAALAAASLWAVATVLYAAIGKRIPPLELNLLKGLIALLFINAFLLATGAFSFPHEVRATLILVISGIIGIGLGDTAYLTALSTLGPRRTLLMETLAPPMAGIIAWIFLSERLSVISWIGILLTLVGVGWVIAERTPVSQASSGESLPRKALVVGSIMGCLAALGQATGAVLSRAALTSSSIGTLWSSNLRLAGGVAILLPWLILRRQKVGQWRKSEGISKFTAILILAPFLGTFLGIWLQQISLAYTSTGVAQTLLTTSPLFVLPIAAATGDTISPRAILGVFIAMAGVALLFIGS